MTKDVERIINRIEGCAFTARLDAQTLEIGADRTSYFADVARYNRINIEELSVLVRELYEVLSNEQFSSIEEHGFTSEGVIW